MDRKITILSVRVEENIHVSITMSEKTIMMAENAWEIPEDSFFKQTKKDGPSDSVVYR